MIVGPEPHVSGYDIIGDVHGCCHALTTLLGRMGYACVDGVYRHPGRKVVFLGDILDRGPHIRETVQVVRRMVDAGAAWFLLGNHEFNAVLFSTPAPAGWDRPWLARRSRNMLRHMMQSLRQYKQFPEEWADLVAWLRKQPLCLEFSNFRAVHACWDNDRIKRLRELNPHCNLASDEFLARAGDVRNEERRIIERLLKGVNMRLPAGFTIRGSDGVERDRFRSAFWHPAPATYGDLIFQPDGLPAGLQSRELTVEERRHLSHYPAAEKPLFVGHYWRVGEPSLLTGNIACLDYSAVRSGVLAGYRMGQEVQLQQSHLVWVSTRQG